MGEFVGIDPSAAHRLIRRMEAGEGLLDGVRPLLEAAVAEAGADWAGRRGCAAVRRARRFLREARRELRWRIDTAEQLVPVRERGLLTVTFPFGGEAEAARTGRSAATAVLAALPSTRTTGPPTGPATEPPTESPTGPPTGRAAGTSRSGDAPTPHQPPATRTPTPTEAPTTAKRANPTERATPTEQSIPTEQAGTVEGVGPDQWAASGGWVAVVERVLGGCGEVVGDPACAAALLAGLGPGGLVLVLRGWVAAEAGGERDGLPPAVLARAAGAAPGLLARAFAAAERTARLGEEWRELPATAPADVLTTLIALARPSGAFLNVVAAELLNRRPDAGPDWNLHHLAHAYRTRPEALQELLAEHPKETGVLLDAYALGTHPAYERVLTEALRHALAPGAGADGLRERAWLGLAGALGGEHRLWPALENVPPAGRHP
ncbi:hypothetical protein [Nonomuraea sp. NPDC050783]|uniref:hypothetical protein n=1 Tax=Nonomuraea sp. NPDC050783 TaxID=3154634 RepID=UPI00346519A5